MPKLPVQEVDDKITPDEAARMLGVTTRTLANTADRGEITAIKLPSGHRRYLRSQIEALVEGEKTA